VRNLIEEVRSLEKLIRQHNSSAPPGLQRPLLFGASSFPESDRLFAIQTPHDATTFASALTPLHRSFVESIDNYGRSIGQNNYFWAAIKAMYPYLHEALNRIRVYRNDGQHLTLLPTVDQAYRRFLERDLPDALFHSADKYWIVFQRCLDELLYATQRESIRLRT
jgi:hypothetical protein